MIVAGTTIEGSTECVRIANEHPELLAGVGIHPMQVTEPINENMYGKLRDLALSSDRVVAISEVGLDFGEKSPDLALQYQAFRAQIQLAKEVRLPIIFHSRELPGQPGVHREVFEVLRQERGWEVGAVMHYFQGDRTTAQQCLELGIYISLGKPLLRLPNLQALVTELPLKNLVLETDASPQPFKGKRENWTEPKDTFDVARKLACLKGIPLTEVEEVTTNNILQLYDVAGAVKPKEALKQAVGYSI